MIDWSQGYSASWRVMEVDPVTWADASEIPSVTNVAVERSDEQMRETGSAEVTLPQGERFGERWVRVEMMATQGSDSERVAVATLHMAQSESDPSKGRQAITLEGRSVLAPAADERLLAGSYVPKGADGAAWVARMLACCPCPVVTEGSFTLGDHVVYAGGTTRLEAAWMLLDAASWTLVIDGDGTVHVCPKPTRPSLDLDRANTRLLVTVPKTTTQLLEVKNRFIAVADGQTAVAVNDDPYDETSYTARGRYVDEYEENPTLVDGETLEAYAKRRLAEVSAHADSKAYEREWWPGVTVGSVVRGGIASVGLEGDMRVTAQSLTCGAGITVSETAEVM